MARVTEIKLSQIEVDQTGKIIINKPELARVVKDFLSKKDPGIKADDEVAALGGFICSNDRC